MPYKLLTEAEKGYTTLVSKDETTVWLPEHAALKIGQLCALIKSNPSANEIAEFASLYLMVERPKAKVFAQFYMETLP